MTPRRLTDVFYAVHKSIYDWFEISYDNFSRTSLPVHHKTTQDLFLKIYENGYVTKGVMRLPYCETDKLFLADRYVVGKCPVCGYEFARGDQCENCATLLEPEQLINPKCKIDGSVPVFKDSDNLFLELEKLQPQLEAWITSQKHWRKQVSSLALAWIKEGLRRRSITRDLKWGVPVPLKGFEDKIFYVWFDAPIGYISSTKEWAERSGHPKRWEDYWLDPETRIYNFLGKDNIPFHTIFWPGMLMASGGLNLPYDVVGLQYCNYEGDKISKSRNWGIFCEKVVQSGLDPDIWRYYLAYLIPETKDSEFKWDDFQTRINNELVAAIGNFVHRTLTFASNFLGGVVERKELGEEERQVEAKVARAGRRGGRRPPGGQAQGRPQERPADRDNRERVLPEEPALGPRQGRPGGLQARHLLLREHLQGARGDNGALPPRVLQEGRRRSSASRAGSRGRGSCGFSLGTVKMRRSPRSSSRR